jgi:uncharacterized protein YabN with tetrapyrrole methylase and pyrophosphatase domain
MPKKRLRKRTSNDITIAGLPIGGLDRTTPETLKAFKTARVILDLTSNFRLFKKFCKTVIDLDKEYWTGGLDEDVYARIADIVLDQSKEGPGVVLVVDGHPGIYQDLSWDIYDRGRRRGLGVTILPAISFLDLMIAFCDIRVDANGLQILDATSVVAFNVPINPYVDTLLMQIGWFGTSLLSEVAENKKGRFEPLARYLTKYYPKEHVIRIIRAPDGANERPKVINARISSLDRFHKSISADMTVFIPALVDENAGVSNEAFLSQTEDKEHLEKIARV